jgi:RimJ/RimL family protein N-acetyltransferase
MTTPRVTIREWRFDDWPRIQQWAKRIGWTQYMSRINPHTFTPDAFPNRDNVCWYVIAADGREVGAVWLEKESAAAAAAVLGILIGEPELHGRGIGRRAIPLAIDAARERLDFDCVELHTRLSNARAIACYTACGFREVSRGVKAFADGSRIAYCTMRRRLSI